MVADEVEHQSLKGKAIGNVTESLELLGKAIQSSLTTKYADILSE